MEKTNILILLYFLILTAHIGLYSQNKEIKNIITEKKTAKNTRPVKKTVRAQRPMKPTSTALKPKTALKPVTKSLASKAGANPASASTLTSTSGKRTAIPKNVKSTSAPKLQPITLKPTSGSALKPLSTPESAIGLEPAQKQTSTPQLPPTQEVTGSNAGSSTEQTIEPKKGQAQDTTTEDNQDLTSFQESPSEAETKLDTGPEPESTFNPAQGISPDHEPEIEQNQDQNAQNKKGAEDKTSGDVNAPDQETSKDIQDKPENETPDEKSEENKEKAVEPETAQDQNQDQASIKETGKETEQEQVSPKPIQKRVPRKRRRTSTIKTPAKAPVKTQVKKKVPPKTSNTRPKKAPIKRAPYVKKTKQSYISMADMPLTVEEKNIQEQEIEKNIDKDLKAPPELDSRLVQQIDSRFRKNTYLANYTEPWKNVPAENNLEMNFENQEISELLKFLEKNLNITFILDDNIGGGKVEGLKPIADHKITFRSNTELSLKQIWDLSLTFLEMSGFSVIPTTEENTYRITASQGKGSANSEPLPTFIATEPDILPDSDLKIRYIYFVENADLSSIFEIVKAIQSASAGALISFPELKALIITDKSSSIKSMLKIIQELDKSDTPETLAIIRLKNADADEVVSLYNSLTGNDEKARTPFGIQQRNTSTTHYFSKSTRLFPNRRTNSLIALGTRENIKKVEDFINLYIDKKSDLPYSPINVYTLKYLDATSLQTILSQAIENFNQGAAGRQAVAAEGGVREGNKFINPNLKIVAESKTNSLIINGDYEDYLKIKELIDALDVEQPQVALKVLILNVDLTNVKELGAQSRNSIACCDKTGGTTSILGPNINYQFSGLDGIVTNPPNLTAGTAPDSPGGERLLGNLINLVSAQNFSTGTTLVTLGKDLYGFWGLLRALESITRVTVVANPFLVTSNKFKAEFSIGETRRVLSSIVQAQNTQPSFSNLDANLSIVLTPQISADDTVTLDVFVNLSQFVTGGELPTISTKLVSTTIMAENREVVALGGLIRDSTQEQEFKVPILGDIPILGWLFKTKTKTVVRSSLLILISPEIIRPTDYNLAQEYTQYQINDTKETIYSMEHFAERRDPIHRWFFKDHLAQEVTEIDKFASNQARYVSNTAREKEREKAENAVTENKQLLAQNNTLNSAPKDLLGIIKQDSENNKDGEVIT